MTGKAFAKPGMEIEPFDETALPAIVSISIRAWAPVFESIERALDPRVFAHFYPDWREEQAKSVEETCSSPDMRVWTANEGDSIVGFVAVKLHRESGMGEIYMVAVDPDHQRRGIGRALMDRATDWMRASGMAVAMVETGADPGHAPARRVYERMGFKNFPVARYFMKL